MSKKKSQSPWGRIRSERVPRNVVTTNVPINRMNEVDDDKKNSLPKLAHEAWQKEHDLRKAEGPHSIPEPHYPKSIFLKREKE